MTEIKNAESQDIVLALVDAIKEHKEYLGEIDGQIGDGDHGINMYKGFSLCAQALQEEPGDLSHGLQTLSRILMSQIGGSMGPLYGMFFKAMAKACNERDHIDRDVFGAMLSAAREKVCAISGASVGDKSLLDVLVPAEAAYREAAHGGDFTAALSAMEQAAVTGRDSTKDMVSNIGRSSRLGERSRGVIDAGAASCCLILQTFSQTIRRKMH